MFQIIKALHHLDEQIREVLKLDEQVKELAEHLYQHKSLLIMGRGYNYATCMEGALVSRFLSVTLSERLLLRFNREW
jgi:glucosamine--fructose-6-phosphate aminotransferase (isomerizing)